MIEINLSVDDFNSLPVKKVDKQNYPMSLPSGSDDNTPNVYLKLNFS